MSTGLSRRARRLPDRVILAIGVIALTIAATVIAASVIAASAGTSFGPGRIELQVVAPETAQTGFGATSSEVAVLGEPATQSVSQAHGSRTLLAF